MSPINGSSLKIDLVKRSWLRADAVCFDVDSTVCRDEAIDELAKYVGKFNEVSDITKSAMQGGADFRSALKKRLDIIKPDKRIVEKYLEEHSPRLTDNIKELISILNQRRIDVYLVSGGFDVIIEPAAKMLNIPLDRVFANRIKFDSDGCYAGFDTDRPTSQQDGKSIVVSKLKKIHGYKNLIMIGDGKTDMEACPPADAFIGFGGNQVREQVRAGSDWFVYSFQELIDELVLKETNGYNHNNISNNNVILIK